MDNPTILVADGDPKNLQILRESLEASGFEVIVASDGLQAWQKISSDVPDLILSEVNLPKLDGFQLLEKLKADPVTSSIPLMFLTNRRELQDRVRSLRGGVKDYMIKPLHVKEVIARVRMILRRMERIREEEIESNRKLAGRLEEFSVIDLIENFGMERKTGILTLYNANNRSGEIYFRDGAVINASLGNLRAEKAVYQMLPWKRGHFTMTFKEINVPDEISVSNLGLLLQGFKRMEERERLFKMLPSPETTFVTTETFRNIIQKRELSTDVAKFIALIDGRRDILQIIDESTYDDIKTLERLVKLYQQGFIKPSKMEMAEDEGLTDIVSSIAEPEIVQQFDLSPNRESRFTEHPPLEKEKPSIIRPETTRPTPAQGFREPEVPPYAPPERKRQEVPVVPREPRQVSPTSSRKSSQANEPPPVPALPEDKIGESEEVPAAPERLPIDLSELLQRPSPSSPFFEEPQVELPLEISEADQPAVHAPEVKPQGAVESEATAEPLAPPVPEIRPPQEALPELLVAPTPEAQAKAAETMPPVMAPEVTARVEPTVPTPEVTTPQTITPPIIPSTPLPITPIAQPVPSAMAPESRPQPIDPITACLIRLVESRPVAKPKLVIIGRNGHHISPMVRHLLGPESSLRKLESVVFQYLELGERRLLGSKPFEIIGISMEQQFTRLLDAAGSDLVGYIVLVEAYRREGIEYLSYLLNMLKSVYRRPLGIAIIKSSEQKNLAIDTLRDLLNVATTDFLQECNPADKLAVTEFLTGFTGEANLQRWNTQEKSAEAQPGIPVK
ncbi:MAG: response regulator [candidate division KSB1 bacterium]|nr:response regulator [candidate division KSB1 bacterium]MDZ7304827.1 response regulator [candidate division KSB1 bacterium]MDZ7313907.1 response regulator [candidate division KSB1 bacterium]